MSKISAYAELTSSDDPNDLLVVVDVDDLTMAPTGTTKKLKIGNLSVGSSFRMPWNILGGWNGSTMDPSAVNGNSAHTGGSTYAAALVTDTTTSFSKLRVGVALPQTGTGAAFVVADSAGNHLASATNADTILASSTADFYDMTLSATVTPAAQQVLYVLFLYPASVTGQASLYVGNGSNVTEIPCASPVPFISWANNNHVADTTIPDPFDMTSLSNTAQFLPFFALK